METAASVELFVTYQVPRWHSMIIFISLHLRSIARVGNQPMIFELALRAMSRRPTACSCATTVWSSRTPATIGETPNSSCPLRVLPWEEPLLRSPHLLPLFTNQNSQLLCLHILLLRAASRTLFSWIKNGKWESTYNFKISEKKIRPANANTNLLNPRISSA